MKKIKINFLHPMIYGMKTEEEKLNALRKSLCFDERKYGLEFLFSEDDMDYLVVSEAIYYGLYCKETQKKYRQLIKKNPVTIFFAGECIEPDLNLFDYAIVFDKKHVYQDRILRTPTILKYNKALIEPNNTIMNLNQATKELENKKYFCNFIYSNAKAHPNRDKLFHILNKYKKVNSLGKHLKNFEIEDPEIRNMKDWLKQSIAVKSEYKFSISAENAQYDGYASEKLLTSFASHSIPIYWGDSTISEEFNTDAFINCHDYDNLEDVKNVVKKINENDELWLKMIQQPWQTPKQKEETDKEVTKYLNNLSTLFMQPKEKAYRKAEGFHPENYRKSFESGKEKSVPVIKKIKKTIKKIIMR